LKSQQHFKVLLRRCLEASKTAKSPFLIEQHPYATLPEVRSSRACQMRVRVWHLACACQAL
jgi:hypothetical protein